jgi:hypothetical protein
MNEELFDDNIKCRVRQYTSMISRLGKVPLPEPNT